MSTLTEGDWVEGLSYKTGSLVWFMDLMYVAISYPSREYHGPKKYSHRGIFTGYSCDYINPLDSAHWEVKKKRLALARADK